MSTAPGVIMFWGDSRMVGSYGDTQNMGMRGKIMMAFPQYICAGTVNDLVIGPQSTASAIYNMWVGQSRSKHAATNGYTIANVDSVAAARIAAVGSPVPTVHVIFCGMNNMTGGDSAATMQTQAASLLDTLHAATPSAKCVWIGEPNAPYNGAIYEPVRVAFNSGMSGTVIPARSAWAHWIPTTSSLGLVHWGDIAQIHQNAWGHNVLADIVIAGLKAIPI